MKQAKEVLKPESTGALRKCHPLLTLIMVGGLFGLLPTIAFRPDCLPSMDIVLGPYGATFEAFTQDHRSAIRNTFLILAVLHLTEAVIAMMMCAYMDLPNGTTLKWGLDVFVHGIFSFRFLIDELYTYEQSRQGTVDYFAHFLRITAYFTSIFA